MKLNIGAILSPPAKAFLEKLLPELSSYCDITPIEVSDMNEGKRIFSQRFHEFDAMVFSGIILMVYCTGNNYELQIPCYSFEDMSIDLLPTLYNVLLHNRNFDFSRSSVDGVITYMDPLGYKKLFPKDQIPYIMGDTFKGLFNINDTIGMELTQKVLVWHRELYRSGKTDLVITRYGAICRTLEEEGIPYVYITPSKEYVVNFFLQIVSSIRTKTITEFMVGIIALRFHVDNEEDHNTLENRCSAILSHYARKNGLNFSFGKNKDKLEIILNYKDLALITDNFTVLPLIQELDEEIREFLIVGIGTGNTFFQARLNAGSAISIAGTRHKAFYVSYDNKVVGPLGERPQKYELNPFEDTLALSQRFKIDHFTVQQLFAYSRASEKTVVTALELAEFMDVSRRTANRILTKVLVAGGARIYEENPTSGKGRPTLKYELLFIH